MRLSLTAMRRAIRSSTPRRSCSAQTRPRWPIPRRSEGLRRTRIGTTYLEACCSRWGFWVVMQGAVARLLGSRARGAMLHRWRVVSALLPAADYSIAPRQRARWHACTRMPADSCGGVERWIGFRRIRPRTIGRLIDTPALCFANGPTALNR